jgi:Family of unknown function (DUF5989)
LLALAGDFPGDQISHWAGDIGSKRIFWAQMGQGGERLLSPRFELGIFLSFFAEFLAFLRARKKYWLAPIMIVMLLLGGLLVFTSGSVVAPFIYTLF